MQPRRTTRASRLVVAEDAPTTRATISRAPGSKLRAAPGLTTKVTHDPNVKRHQTSQGSKDFASAHDNTSSTAPVKRKREALGEVTVKNGRTKAPIPDKENQQKAVPYVELPTAPPKTRAAHVSSSTAVPASRSSSAVDRRTGASSTTAPRTRIAVSRTITVKDDVKVVQPEAMIVDEVPAPPATRASRRISNRGALSSASAAGSASTRRIASTTRRTTSTTTRTRRIAKPEEPEYEEPVQHVAKKLRTSSPVPDVEVLRDTANAHMDEDMVEAEEQARTDEAKWDDLDKEDEGDPLMVAEYVVEIFDYLQHLERVTMPSPNYMDTQKDLAWKMRGILTDWLIGVHAKFRLLPETLFLAVNIVDRFLSARSVSLVRLQLVGITAMFLAAKYEEVMTPCIANFIYCSDSTYTEQDIREAEKYILRSIDYNLSYPNPINFLRRASKADGYDLQVRTIAKYLIEISCVDWKMLSHPPSMVAAAGIWLARLILDKEDWTPNLEHYSGYTEEALLPAAQHMLTYLLRAVKHELFYKKYAAKKYLKVSAYVRDWAWAKFGMAEVEYDDEGESLTGLEAHKNIVHSPTSIILADELPRLKAESKVRREEDMLIAAEEAARMGAVQQIDE